jgi:aspartyl-tRNA(Asn)/glutamyl-tRNA(Gln) amidotransferase subunit C
LVIVLCFNLSLASWEGGGIMREVDIERLEKLAAIELTDEEREKFKREITLILDYFSQIDELDTEDGGISYHEHLGYQRFREDIPEKGLKREEALSNAPEVEEDYFKIPPVLG